jgi:hypothetical protein
LRVKLILIFKCPALYEEKKRQLRRSQSEFKFQGLSGKR